MQGNIRILIIEDDKILLQTYKKLIEAEDNLVVVNGYTSFEAAEKNLTADDPDVVLLDIQLPGINGIAAIPLIKNTYPRLISSSLLYLNLRTRYSRHWQTELQGTLQKILHRKRSLKL
jgi:DNA-binding NarL/FixJ family response regulator